MDLSIVILNYKSKDLVLKCLKSIFEADFMLPGYRLSFEIIVVDNASFDGVGELLKADYPGIVFIQNTANVGMGAGNNIGIKKAKGKYTVVMNPDILVHKDTFRILYEYMERHADVGVCGPRQLNTDKSIQYSCYRFPKIITPVYRRTPLGKFAFAKKELSSYLMEDFDHMSERKVDWLLGSFLFIRSAVIESVGLFDERFWMYFEDTDYCRRFWKNKWNVVYFPAAEVIHDHQRESAKAQWYNFISNRMTRQHIVSWFKYFLKWRGKTT